MNDENIIENSSEWNKSLEIGIPLIDMQHQSLFSQIKILRESIKNNDAKNAIKKMLEFLESYVVKHFADEERMMDMYNCPARFVNRAEHLQFLNKFSEYKSQFEQSLPLAGFNTYLHEWTSHHIKTIDKQLADYIKR